MRFLQLSVGAAILVVMLCLAGGYLGRVHPAGDSFAVFRAPGALALILLAGVGLVVGMPGPAVIALVVGLLTGGPFVVAQQSAEASAAGLLLYQKNMLFKNSDLAGLEADIRAAAPDVLTLQEVSAANRPTMDRLADVLPHQLFCPFEWVGGVALATRLTPVPGTEFCVRGMAAMQVEGPEGPVWLVSVHLHWPWPFDQAAHLARLVPVLERLQGKVLIAGDFNMVRWSAALGRVRAAARAAAVGPVLGTYAGFAPALMLPIDHVMAPGGGTAVARPLFGSDHLGVLARVRL